MFSHLKEIFYLLGDDRRRLPWLIVIFIVSSLLDIAGLGMIGPYVALVVNPDALSGTSHAQLLATVGLSTEPQDLLVILGLGLIAVFVLKAAAAILINRSILLFSFKRVVQIRAFLMSSFQSLPYTEYLRRNSSEYIYAIHGLTTQFQGIMQSILRLISEGLVGIVILIFLALNSGSVLGLVVILLGGMILVYDRIFRRNIREYGRLTNEHATRMVQGIHEGMEGLKEIRILNKEEHFRRTVTDSAKRYSEIYVKSQIIRTAPRYLLELILVTFVVILVLGALSLGQDLNALVPTLGIFGIAALRLMPAANTIYSSLAQLRFGRNATSLLYADLKQLEQRSASATKQTVSKDPEPFQTLTLQNVCFAYPNARQSALNEVSLTIRAGESIGLIGPSGSGKTTLVDVLLGLLEPQLGKIQYNYQPMQERVAEWRANVAYLPQQVFLIDNTLRCNVALGVLEEEIDEQRFSDALQKARLSELVQELPDGVETIIGERGIRLSGGQRQRVALARAFYHGRSVLVMDEATSALDYETEHEIVEEIKQLKGQKTIIVIAHRLTTVQPCDRIYRLDKGEIVEQGSYADVVGSLK